MKYEINTVAAADGTIIQTVDMMSTDKVPGGSMRERLITRVMDTCEAQIKGALMQLGWTPPASKVSALPNLNADSGGESDYII